MVGHIQLKNVTDNAGLESHTMPIREEVNWKETAQKLRRESVAKEIIKITVMTSHNYFLQVLQKRLFRIY